MFQQDNPHNNYKNITHAFFIALAISVAEPSTILPLMIHHFSDNVILIGFFISLLRGGAITIQLYAAFHAQAYRRVLPYLGKVFLFRFLAWLSIGLSIYFIGDSNRPLTLFFIGLGLFFFSFMAGFGAIYFKELQAKLFSKSYRGKTMANRQVASAVASIISGGVAGYVLYHYEAPQSYAYLFMVSSLFMTIGFVAFITIDEPEKERISTKEKHFGLFLKHAIKLLRSDKRLQEQVWAIFLSYSCYLAMPFVILNANTLFTLTGWMLGGFITIQMVGSILGSSLLWRNIDDYEWMLSLSFLFMMGAFFIALVAETLYGYTMIFLLFGVAMDGFRNAGMNLIIEIAPEEKRPVYTAIQTNLSSFGLFFPIFGGVLLEWMGSYGVIYGLTILLLGVGFIISRRFD
jgi:MFS family permease